MRLAACSLDGCGRLAGTEEHRLHQTRHALLLAKRHLPPRATLLVLFDVEWPLCLLLASRVEPLGEGECVLLLLQEQLLYVRFCLLDLLRRLQLLLAVALLALHDLLTAGCRPLPRREVPTCALLA